MRFNIRFILFGVMPFLAIMAAVASWTPRAVTFVFGYYFTFIWWGGFVAITQRQANARRVKKEAADEV